MQILVTGSAGFIGFHLTQRLLSEGHRVVGFDNLNDYYDVNLKLARLERLNNIPGFSFVKGDVSGRSDLEGLFGEFHFDRVVHLAAQAGVRYSLENPHAYIEANIQGMMNILEACRHARTEHLVYASSSSVYGANTGKPFSVMHNVDNPVSLYAATKKANELMAHTYSHLYGLPTTGLRFFTVYGPWGRPDMALFLFTKAILAGKPIKVFNHGNMMRDFTYIDDIVEGVCRVMQRIPQGDPTWNSDQPVPGTSRAPYCIYNIGNNKPVRLLTFIETLEAHLGMKAEKQMLPIQPGDVPETFADIDHLVRDVGFAPATTIDEGIGRFVTWYRSFYGT